jgi:hypothetical protein
VRRDRRVCAAGCRHNPNALHGRSRNRRRSGKQCCQTIGEAPRFGVRPKEQAVSPVLIGNVNAILAPISFEWRPIQQSLAVMEKPFSAGGGMGWLEKTVIFPLASENAKRGSGQTITAPNNSANVTTAPVAQSSVCLITLKSLLPCYDPRRLKRSSSALPHGARRKCCMGCGDSPRLEPRTGTHHSMPPYHRKGSPPYLAHVRHGRSPRL